MAKLTTIYWRDIPAQVFGQQGRTRHKQELSKRFAVAIDRAAMRAGKGSSNAYLDEWRREAQRVEARGITSRLRGVRGGWSALGAGSAQPLFGDPAR